MIIAQSIVGESDIKRDITNNKQQTTLLTSGFS